MCSLFQEKIFFQHCCNQINGYYVDSNSGWDEGRVVGKDV